MWRGLVGLALVKAERALAARRSTAQALALRARIVLACAEGAQNQDVAARLGVGEQTVSKWRRRFAGQRLEGLRDEPRSGAPRTVDDARIEAVITATLESAPPDATHWSSRSMAAASGLSMSTVQRVWRAFGLAPHRMDTFKRSTDPAKRAAFARDFVAKVRDVVGLHMAPPDRALVLCVEPRGSPDVDGKSRIEALNRSQPMLPMRPGQPARRSHDYTRHGTCLVPESRDAALTREAEKAPWQAVLAAAPGQRREFEPSSKRRKKRLAPYQPLRAEPDHRRQVADPAQTLPGFRLDHDR